MFIAKISDRNYIDLSYLKKFLLIFISLYGFNLLFTALVTPKNIYVPFLDHNLNYISGLTIGLLYSSDIVAEIMGMNTYVASAETLRVVNGTYVIVGTPCLGLGVMIFWTAFILAAGEGWKKKLTWCLGGLAAICFINSIRIAFILMAYENKWQMVTSLDHHTAFNVLAYVLIFFMIYLFYRRDKKEFKV